VARETNPTISADGRRIAFVRSGLLIVKDLASGKETTIVREPANTYPSFSKDGRLVLFSGTPGGDAPPAIDMVPDSGIREKLCAACGLAPVISPDGRTILYDWGNPRYLGMVDVSSKTGKPWLTHPTYGIYQVVFSPDGEWLTFVVAAAPERTRLAVAPFRHNTAPPEKDWIYLTDGSTINTRPRWSPDSRTIYFISDRDGSRCIYAQKLDTSRHPAGAVVSIFHPHRARLNILNVGLTGSLGLGIAEDKIVFNMSDVTGNIWLGKPAAKSK
jgi:Tol biopolymer transport system component